MTRIPVTSSTIASIGFDSSNEILEIEFTNNTIYQYSRVPESTYLALLNANSHGQYFNTHIKNAGYKLTKSN